MTGFQDFTTKSQISSLSQFNPELVTEAIYVHWNYFLRESKMYSLHPNARSASSKFFHKVTLHPVLICPWGEFEESQDGQMGIYEKKHSAVRQKTVKLIKKAKHKTER